MFEIDRNRKQEVVIGDEIQPWMFWLGLGLIVASFFLGCFCAKFGLLR